MGAVAEMTPAFRAQMRRLIGLKFAPADLTTHWEALHDMPEALLEAAVDVAQRDCGEFPSPKMLKSFADQVRARVVPVPQEEDRSEPNPSPLAVTVPHTDKVIPLKRYWRYYCEDCSDSGWQSIWCGDPALAKPWQSHGHCGRNREHGPHEFVVVCPCASSNPDVQRRRERERQGGKRGESE